jgi:hypothetical protein
LSKRVEAQAPLTNTEREDILTAVQSVFRKVKKLHAKVAPIYAEYGFKPPSAGVNARDISERIETSIAQHCESFEKRAGHADLWRGPHPWEVKICKDSGLTINQSKVLKGETYIVVNYREDSTVSRIWVLWRATDELFSPRRVNSNARGVDFIAAKDNIEALYTAAPRARARGGSIPKGDAPER